MRIEDHSERSTESTIARMSQTPRILFFFIFLSSIVERSPFADTAAGAVFVILMGRDGVSESLGPAPQQLPALDRG
jgi:hypothetical protein